MKTFLTRLRPLQFFIWLSIPCTAPLAQTLTLSSSGERGMSGTHWTSSGNHPVTISFTGTATIHPSVVIGYLNSGSDVRIEPADGRSDIVVATDLSAESRAKIIFKTSGTIDLRAPVTSGGAQIYLGRVQVYGSSKLTGSAICFNESLSSASDIHLQATQGDLIIRGNVQAKGSFTAQLLGAQSQFLMGVDGINGKGSTLLADKGITIAAAKSYIAGELHTISHDINLYGNLELAQFAVPVSLAPTTFNPANGNLFLKGGTLTAYAGTLREYTAESDFLMEKIYGSVLNIRSNTREATNAIEQYGLSLGKDGNQGDVHIENAVTLNGPITIHGHNILLTGPLTATHSLIRLQATGTVTQTAPLIARGLDLQGKGSFSLTHAENAVETITGGKPTAKLVSLAYRQTGNLSIGRGDHDGLESTGPIHIATTTGNIIIEQHISTASTAKDAIIINAGQNKPPGDMTGGSIRINGTKAIKTGTGGVVQLFIGSKKG